MIFAEMRTHTNMLRKIKTIVHGFFLKRQYEKYKKALEESELVVYDKDLMDLKNKFDKFLSSLSSAQIVYFAHYDINRTLGELAFYELVNRDKEFRKSFERKEIEALGAFFVRGFPYSISEFSKKDREVFIQGDRINDLKHTFAISKKAWEKMHKRFLEVCKNIYRESFLDEQVQPE